MKAKIREMIDRAKNGPPVVPGNVTEAASGVLEQYYTPIQAGKRFCLVPSTIRILMFDETDGVIRIGTRISTAKKRRHVTERYSESALLRLARRLEN
jgi:hypothetical protein